ncbi:hypothetical protein [uncultured Arcobacter sp.]|uniref:hypothetical protein n=1 Tax=uncultured Arcobacter sp. TaxID=165434 RepID=UPI0026017636|nr:hypothetical protein [uncultured Arcobacter sp.]
MKFKLKEYGLSKVIQTNKYTINKCKRGSNLYRVEMIQNGFISTNFRNIAYGETVKDALDGLVDDIKKRGLFFFDGKNVVRVKAQHLINDMKEV